MPRHSTPRRVVACAALTATLAGCATGERPSFRDEEAAAPVVSSGNPDVDTVLEMLSNVERSEFTAGYEIETFFNSVSSTGSVVHAPGKQRSIIVRNDDRHVQFIIDGDNERTCNLLTDECEVSLNDARISDTQLPHTFYGPAFSRRLAADAARRISDPELYEKSVAGQVATCVDIDVSGGTKTYCALPSGPLAEFVGADVTIELTSYSPQPDLAVVDDF